MAISDPNKSGWDILEAAARGIVTGVLINRMCQIKRIGPILSKIFMAFGAAGQFESIITNIKEGNIDLAITGTIQLLIQIMSVHQTCFTGETLVAAENGQIRIDEIKVGDKIWAYDIHTGKNELKEVLTVYVHDQTEILHLHTTAGDIDTTTNHPFYVIGRGWVAAGDINEGDEVFLIDGSTAVLKGAELEKLEEPIKVYNLEVEDYNTFFVGDEAVLVHNRCSDHSKKLRENMSRESRAVGSGDAAAHIVSSGGSKNQWESAVKSRNLLAKYGIDIDTAANGIPLGHPNPHGKTHTRAFNDGVFGRLSNLENNMIGSGYGARAIRSAILRTLRSIGNQVLDGDFYI